MVPIVNETDYKFIYV